MLIIGLSGGIGSGKSTVARELARRGFPVVDADEIARRTVPECLPELVQRFGAITLPDGSLDRSALAAVAFSSPENTAALNAITHPRIQEETNREFIRHRQAGKQAIIYDMPLLVDKGLHEDMDLVVIVDVAPDERVRRLAGRGISAEDARRRIDAQIPDSVRLAAADVVIDNNGELGALVPQVDALEKRIRDLAHQT